MGLDTGPAGRIVDRRLFEARKRAFLERLEREALQGRVDGDIYPLLRRLNQHPRLYTTSSCSGRILLAQAALPSYSKGKGFRPVARWHSPVPPQLVAEAVDQLDDAWLMVRGAILHVAAADARTAYRLVEIGRATGHKHSGIIAINRAGIFVEVLGEERLDIPLKLGGRPLADVEEAVEAANRTLVLAKLRLFRLAAMLEARLMGGPAPPDEEVKAAIRRFLSCLQQEGQQEKQEAQEGQ